jgi:signal transduction histidine kinase
MRSSCTLSGKLLYMKLILTLFWVVPAFPLVSQDTTGSKTVPEATYTVDSIIPWHQLASYAWVLIDSSNQLEISTVITKNQDLRFKPLSSFIPPGGPNLTYWLKLSLTGEGNIQGWWLLFNNDSSTIEFNQHLYIDAWLLDSENKVLEHQQTGQFVPRSKKAIKENPGLNRILFSINHGDTRKLYLKIYNGNQPTTLTSLDLRNPVLGIPGRSLITEFSVLSSVALLFAIISFFLFFFVHEKSYLFFGIYTLLLSQHYLILHQDLPFVDLYIPEYPQLAGPAFILLTNGGFVFFLLFGKFFINLRELSSKLDATLRFVLLVWVGWILVKAGALMVIQREFLPVADLVFIFLFIIFLIRIAFFNNILVRFYVAGALWLIIFTILGILRNNSMVSLPFNPWPVGQLGQLLIYAAGLAYKIKMNEKARTQAELIKLRNVELAGLYADSEKQKDEIEIQKMNAEKALEDLKNTQAQLIQSEKMASLGELTAGIAHEIQNPLNFVNNFSEVNVELIQELKNERIKGIELQDDKLQDEIIQNIGENSGKITFHGKRADAIVKGMLHHSRTNSGIKEPTDINELVDEYLRLAYHGLRAKDKTFNASLLTDFDPTIGTVQIDSQEIGRVVLNLINNAFYAVKSKLNRLMLAATSMALEEDKPTPEPYEPTVLVSTKRMNGKVVIRVRDNGDGIPQFLWDKIFQPFFTTKPSGQGTGLGLSISYDIIKSQGGDLTIDSKEGEYAEFIVELPNL